MALLSDFGRTFHHKQTYIIKQQIESGKLEPLGVPADVIASLLKVATRGFASGGGYDIPSHRDAQTYVTKLLRVGSDAFQ